MPKLNKCWYNQCDSNDRDNPKLLYYRFPKDAERRQLWINNCNNQELTDIWNSNPEKVCKYRVCQKHFLKEFLGSSSRLVGHAVPAPYGVSLDQINIEKFMMDCANLKSTSSILNKHLVGQQQDNLEEFSMGTYCSTEQKIAMINQEGYNTFESPPIDVNHQSTVTTSQNPPIGLLMTIDQHSSYPQLVINSNNNNSSSFYEDPSRLQFYSSHSSQNQEQQSSNILQDTNTTNCVIIEGNNTDLQMAPYQQDITTTTYATLTTVVDTDRSLSNKNPKINYDHAGKVVSIHYPEETIPVSGTDHNDQNQSHIIALKHKVRHYQRKLAVVNHRYQKLRSQIKGRSNKMRLLESLEICKGEFDPCIFEIFKRQIKGPVSKNGNRWSVEVKMFSSSIYLRSRSAYRFVRKTIDLPSESIVKRYIKDKNLSKVQSAEQDNEEDDEGDNDIDDGDDEKEDDDEDDYEENNLVNNELVLRDEG